MRKVNTKREGTTYYLTNFSVNCTNLKNIVPVGGMCPHKFGSVLWPLVFFFYLDKSRKEKISIRIRELTLNCALNRQFDHKIIIFHLLSRFQWASKILGQGYMTSSREQFSLFLLVSVKKNACWWWMSETCGEYHYTWSSSHLIEWGSNEQLTSTRKQLWQVFVGAGIQEMNTSSCFTIVRCARYGSRILCRD